MTTSKAPIINNLDEKAIEKLIYYATKAPSGHNTQPWQFKVRGSAIEIHPNFKYALPVVDPNHRELYISLGCATENLCVAATHFGFTTKWSIQEGANKVFFIQINLDKWQKAAEHPLFKNIEKRQTNRSVFDGQSISETIIEKLTNIRTENSIHSYFFKKGTRAFSTLQKYIFKGNSIQMRDKAFKNELINWIRFNKKEVNQLADGLSYEVMGSPAMPKFLGKLIVKSFLNPKTQNETDMEKIESSSHFVVLTTEFDTTREWILLGIYMERFLLNLTELGIANAYLNPPCELPNLAAELQKELPINEEIPTIIMRLGYAAAVPFSPRRAVSTDFK